LKNEPTKQEKIFLKSQKLEIDEVLKEEKEKIAKKRRE
jgi:hypothetical protein